MINTQIKKYDLEDRTLEYAKQVINLIKQLPKDTVNIELASQCVRSAGSVGANYREANEALGRKDFHFRVRIGRKEAKETRFWLQLILYSNPSYISKITPLISESTELIKIFSSMIKV